MTSGGSAADGAAQWAAAAQVRSEHPGWVVIWSPARAEFQARPLFRAPRGTVAAGRTPAELVAQMDAIRAAAPHRAALPPAGSTAGSVSPSADSQTAPESS